jgi:hypothetical protein
MPSTLVWVRTPKTPTPQKWLYSPDVMVTGYWDDLIVHTVPLSEMESTLPLWELAEKYPLRSEG